MKVYGKVTVYVVKEIPDNATEDEQQEAMSDVESRLVMDIDTVMSDYGDYYNSVTWNTDSTMNPDGEEW